VEAVKAAAATLPEIEVREELAAVTDEALDALVAHAGGGLFVRGDTLVRMARQHADEQEPGLQRKAGALFVSPAPPAYVREAIDRAALWWKRKYDRKKDKQVRAPALVPAWVAETILARGSWPLPALEGVTTTPMLRADGSILEEPGYDAATGFYFDPTETFPGIGHEPSRTDAGRAALELASVYADVPFVAESDRAAAMALSLTILARPAIDGCVPMIAVRAPAPGTGKTLVADVAFLIALGHDAARTSPPSKDDDMRKLLLSIALSGDGGVLFDDVSGVFRSGPLDMALTGTKVKDRLLGANRMAEAPLRAVFCTSGNNLSFGGALGRRVVPCDLDAGVEHPEDRSGFQHPDLRAWVRQERSRLVAACLTILRAYVVAGKPAHGLSRKGSFEAWDDLVRGALIWAGAGDPLGGQARIREEGDSDLDALRAGLSAWEALLSGKPGTAAEALRRAHGEPEHLGGLAAFAGCDERKLDARRLGYGLRKFKGRLCDGRCFDRDSEDRLVGIRWNVKREVTA
jgi:hypothetical protein